MEPSKMPMSGPSLNLLFRTACLPTRGSHHMVVGQSDGAQPAELREAPMRPWQGRLSQGVADALILLTLTGCRRAEILGLRWREVDLERGDLRLETTESGASTRPIGRAAIEATTTIRSRMYGHAQAPREALVCPSESGSQIDGHNLDRAWRQVRERLGLTMRLHDLRHSAATSILEAGGRLEDAAAALGHRTLRMAQRYA